MDNSEPSTTESSVPSDGEYDLPPGNHPLEVAARRGIGPLSPLGREQWHGQAKPCVSCGQLVHREARECDQCGQDLSPEMLEKMRAHAGPWYVLEHVRPFPGVSLERVIRQIRRGLITETSIIRGPSSDYQWRFAVEIPGLCRYFGKCWSCHEQVSPSDTRCRNCLAYLSFEKPRSTPQPPSSASRAAIMDKTTVSSASAADQYPHPGQHPGQQVVHESQGRSIAPSTARRGMDAGESVSAGALPITQAVASPPAKRSEHLEQLSAIVDRTDLPAHDVLWDEPPRIAGIRATWVAVAVLAVFVVVLMFLTQTRTPESAPPQPVGTKQVLPDH